MLRSLLREGNARFAPAVIVAGLLAAGCFPKAAPVPPAVAASGVTRASTRWPGVTAEALSMGRDRFVAKCNGCHGYPDLRAISEERWPGIVARMGKKADLGDQERDALLHFVLASRQEQTGP
jgi:hypothetical protein